MIEETSEAVLQGLFFMFSIEKKICHQFCHSIFTRQMVHFLQNAIANTR